MLRKSVSGQVFETKGKLLFRPLVVVSSATEEVCPISEHIYSQDEIFAAVLPC